MKYYLALFLFLLFACNQEQKKTELEINPNQFVDKEMKLSDIADSVLYISFDTSVIFRGIRHCELIDDYVLISTGEELLKFTDSGEYIQSIGSVGQGPEEYTSCSQFAIDRENNRIFVLCDPEIVVYSFEGNFQKRIRLPDNLNAVYIQYRNQKLYCFSLIQTTVSQTPYLWGIIDANSGQLVSLKDNTGIKFASDEISVRGNYTSTSIDGTLLYWNHFNDTIFRLEDSKEDLAYLWAKSDFRLTPEKMTNKTDDNCLKPRTILDTRNYLFIEYRLNNKYNICLYDKKQNIFLRHPRRDILNDIDGGLPFSMYDYLYWGDKEYLFQSCSAPDIKEKLSNTANAKLAEWANSLKDDDNDILMLVQLK